MNSDTYLEKIGNLIQENRIMRGWTQAQLAEALDTSQSAINRIEKGGQNISLEMIARIGEVLARPIVNINEEGKINFKVRGGHELSGEINVKTSKNAAVALLCASLLNKGTTTLRRVARIEEVNRLIEVLNSIGVKTRWKDGSDLVINPPKTLDLGNIDVAAAMRTRSIIMFMGPLLNQYNKFELEPFGLSVDASQDAYRVSVEKTSPDHAILLTERGDTVTENVIMAAALHPGTVTIRNASPNYMVQDLCFFLQKLGVIIEGIGTTTLKITGLRSIDKEVEYFPSEDPIEAMSFIAAGIVTSSEITIKRAPIEFLEIELAILSGMGLKYEITPEYKAANEQTRLVDISLKKSKLHAPKDKLHSMPFPGVNMDNLPFLGLIATVAEGRTLVHDWSYENRAIYFTELTKLGANIELVDPHRVYIAGPTHWKSTDMIAPPALRPSVVILLAMLAAPGVSTLRDVYSINRGYEELAKRLNSLGANIETIYEL